MYGYPEDDAADVAVGTPCAPPPAAIDRVVLVAFDGDDLARYERRLASAER